MLLYDRLQFAFTITFHYLFPQLTMGLSLLIVYFKGRFLWTKKIEYNEASKFWMKIFALNFAMGVVTGIPMEFQFGTNWPETYQNPSYPNIFAPGIAFAPPHTISKPRKSANGTEIFPAPPRTGMPSGITAKLVADNIIDSINANQISLKHKGSMGNMGAACIASAGYGLLSGSGVSITTYPIVPDYEKYPKTQGRELKKTFGEIGLAGHWLKLALHYAFIYKAKLKPFWWLIPE